jgi:hypothetical protein
MQQGSYIHWAEESLAVTFTASCGYKIALKFLLLTSTTRAALPTLFAQLP